MRRSAASTRSFFLSNHLRFLLAAAFASVDATVAFGQAQSGMSELRTRADAGDADALNALGNAYANGQGVPQDYPAAVRYYTQAAISGHAAAQYNLGMLAELGRGMSADSGAALRFYLKAAQQGFAPAQFSVGNMYANGMGTARDYAEAAVWFRQAADRGVPEAQYNLGLACELGRGVPKDEAQAQEWYRDAAGHDYARARYNLALMLDEGRGSPADPAGAAENYRAAAEQGFAPAQNNYGILLAEGRPTVPADTVEAYAWLALAVENGAKPAGRDILATKLTAAQRAAAGDRAAILRVQLASHAAAPPGVASVRGKASVVEPATSPSAKSNVTDVEVAALRAEQARVLEALRLREAEKAALEQKLAQANAAPRADPNLVARAEKLAADNSALQARQEAAQRQLGELQAALTEAREAEKKRVAGAGDAATHPLASLPKPAGDQATARAAASEQAAVLRAELADAKALARSLQQANTELERAAGAPRTAEFERAKAELAGLQRSQAADRETLTKLNEQLDGAGKTISELRDHNDELLKDLEVSKQSAAAALAAQAAVARATPDTDASKLEMRTLQTRVRGLESQVEDERANAAQEITALAGQLQRSREANRALMEANRALLGSKQADDSAVKADGEQLNARVQKLAEENEKLRKEQERLTGEALRLSTEKKTAEAALAAAQRAPAVPAAWSQERDNLRAQLEDMFNKLADAEKRSTQLQQSEAAARLSAQGAIQEVARVRAEMVALQGKFSETEKAADQHGASVAELTGLNEKLAGEKAALEAQVARQSQLLDRARMESAELKTRVGSSDRFAEENATTIENLRTANQKLQGDLRALADEVTSLRAGGSRLAEAEQARATAEQRAANLAIAATQLGPAQREISTLRAENVRLNENLQALDRDRTARIAQLQQENAAIAARLRQAQGTLDQIAAAARIINGSAELSSASSAAARPASSPLPAANTVTAPARYHSVVEGDSLSRISVRYYGTTNRWQEIYDANRELLRGENTLRPGQRLRIP